MTDIEAQIDELTKQVTAQREAVKAIRSYRAGRQAALGDAEERCAAAQAEIDELQDEIRSLDAELAEECERFRSKQLELKRLQTEMSVWDERERKWNVSTKGGKR